MVRLTDRVVIFLFVVSASTVYSGEYIRSVEGSLVIRIILFGSTPRVAS